MAVSGSGGSPKRARAALSDAATWPRSAYDELPESVRTTAWGRPSTSAARQPPYSAASRTMSSGCQERATARRSGTASWAVWPAKTVALAQA